MQELKYKVVDKYICKGKSLERAGREKGREDFPPPSLIPFRQQLCHVQIFDDDLLKGQCREIFYFRLFS
jgi:hypothetical protein